MYLFSLGQSDRKDLQMFQKIDIKPIFPEYLNDQRNKKCMARDCFLYMKYL